MTNFHKLTISGEEYRLRLTVGAILSIEKKLGKSLYTALENIQDNIVETMTTILWGALQPLNGDISFSKALEIFDQYIDEGHSIDDMMQELNAMFEVSGFFNKGQAA